MKKSKFLLLLALSLVLSAFLAGCYGGEEESGGATDGSGDDGGTEETKVTLTESAEAPGLDTALEADTVSFSIMNNVFEGLYRISEDNEPVPAMAESVDISEDEMTYTFTLREGVTWSNGEAVTANDFVYAWRKALDPALENDAQYGVYMLGGVIKNATEVNAGEVGLEELGVTAPDDKTLVVELVKPTPYFLYVTAFPTLFPQNKAYNEEVGTDYATNAGSMIYNGPYVLDTWKGPTGQEWVYTKNEDYWDAENVDVEEIEVRVVKEASTAANLWDAGDVDLITLTGNNADLYADAPEKIIYEEATVFWLKLNQQDPALQNVNIRKALNMAINKEAMVNDIIKDGSVAANYFIPSNFVTNPETGEDFREAYGDFYEYDPEQAAELFATGLEELGQDAITLEILGGDTENAKNIDQFIQAQLESNLEGLTVDLAPVTFKTRLDRDLALDYQMQNAGWGADFLDAKSFANLWITDGSNNSMAYSSEKYDALIEQASNEFATDPVKRFEAFQEAERVFMEEDAAIVPLYQRSTSYLIRENIEGLVPHPAGAQWDYKYMSLN
ncbi:peptide ABC transporter substrate-binding protein [Bacillus fonticola]|uniref:peptide ABC transporter substrate-binding protein n=1 Tax=Bacillus fonticola TaxID=2728853 RepID=UPI0014734E15|nr:peptide ABC transporter substrate-binding protein [Bacillus fonticola]